MPNKIALLATGDEITNGDILNTNSQRIAQQLTEQGLVIGMHMAVSDVEQDIIDAIHFLVEQHEAIIITGGLGPTSDDRTRFALAQAVQQSLVFDEQSWQWIMERLASFNLTVPESNKQQALFPKHATIIPNARGTAPGCYVQYKNKLIFMLPGPPMECIPMFQEVVLPTLLKRLKKNELIQRKWRLFGVSEGHIATQLDEALAHYKLSTGYRIDYPYIEFKVFAEQQNNLEQLWQEVESLVAPHLLSHEHIPASKVLIDTLKEYQGNILIEDDATGGRLASTLLKPKTSHALTFHPLDKNSPATLQVKITGLDELWKNQLTPGQTSLQITFIKNNQQEIITKTFPFRHEKVLQYAIEIICYEIGQRI